MKALVIIGVFFGGAVVLIVGMFWLMAATTPDQSDLDEEVDVLVLDATEERRASSVSRFGHRVRYSYESAGVTYVGDEFVPLQRWQPGLPLRACINPDSPAQHTLHLTPDVECGTYVGTEATATPRQSGR